MVKTVFFDNAYLMKMFINMFNAPLELHNYLRRLLYAGKECNSDNK